MDVVDCGKTSTEQKNNVFQNITYITKHFQNITCISVTVKTQ